MIRERQRGVSTYTELQREAHFTLQTASQQVMLAHSVANLQVCSRAESDAAPQQRKTLLINLTFADIHRKGKKVTNSGMISREGNFFRHHALSTEHPPNYIVSTNFVISIQIFMF